MDSRRRYLERSASLSGDPGDAARVLLERLRAEPPCKECAGTGYLRRCGPNKFWSDANSRMAAADEVSGACSSCAGTGSILRARVECAAWAGSEAAKLVTNDYMGPAYAADCSLPEWLAGLARWGVKAQVAAALGAARGCYPHVATSGRFYPAWHSLEAASAWLACPCEEHKAALSGNATVLRSNMVPTEDAWWAAASGGVWRLAHDVPAYGGMGAEQQAALAVTESARLAGEPAVREAAAAAVRRWALDGEA